MPNLTSQQAKELADNLLSMANALGNYRYENFDSLSEDENLRIKELHLKQLEDTTQLYTKAAVLVMDNVEVSLQSIDAITQQTKTLYNKLASVQTVLDRATSISTLVTAIIGLNPKEITSSIKSLMAPVV